MAKANIKGVKPGSSVGAQMIRIENPVVTNTGVSNVDFEITQPAGTIIDSIFLHVESEIKLSGGGASSDVTVTCGTNTNHAGTELFDAETILDYSAAVTAAQGKVVKVNAIDLATATGTVASDETTFYGRVILGATATVVTSGNLEVHVVYRSF
tara:strand:- start:1148 stop:1609 length:462 start_codon:yes stop_codon:yes gene_type:complete